MNNLFKHKNYSLSYSTHGNGEKTILMFHGFGQTKESFLPLIHVLKRFYTIHSFDLFFHGSSTIDHPENIIAKSEWVELITQFMAEKSIQKVTIAGYSLGGKFSLVLVEAFPERIDHILLIAPDGIRINFWYALATNYMVPRALFQKTIDNPILFTKLAASLERLRMLDKSMIKFAKTQMNTKEKRHRVYHSWVGFRHLKVDIRKLAKTINESEIKTEIFLGKHDKMITKRVVSSLVKNIKNCNLIELDTGHSNLIHKVGEFYKSNLKEW